MSLPCVHIGQKAIPCVAKDYGARTKNGQPGGPSFSLAKCHVYEDLPEVKLGVRVSHSSIRAFSGADAPAQPMWDVFEALESTALASCGR